MTTPTRVLWLIKGLGRGGAERLLTISAPHVDRRRFAVEVAYVLPHKDALVGELEAQGVPVHCIGGEDRRLPHWPLRLRELLRERDYGLVHTHSPVPAVVARLLTLRKPARLVHTEHNTWSRYRRPTYVANAISYRRNDAVFAVSHEVVASMRPLGSRPPVETLLHGIDEHLVRRGSQAREQARARLGLDPRLVVIGTVGNCTPKKDQATLLRATRRLVEEHPHLCLVIVGSGPLEEALRAQAARDGLEQRVLFAGSRDDVQEILPALDVFVLSSIHEGLSIALVEALAAGLPCVATRAGGIPEVITHGHEGLLVPPGDPRALAAAIGALLADPQRRAAMAVAAVARARRFSIAAAVSRTVQVYEQVLAA